MSPSTPSLADDDIVILSAQRTPIGDFQGVLSSLSATQLGSIAIQGALDRAQLPPDQVSSVLMGCVLPAGLGQAPARQASIGAGIPKSVGCTTINKVCGSAMQAMILGHDSLKAGSATCIVAGGMESMSNAPYLMPKARQGYRLGHQRVLDHLFFDGLEDAYEPGKLMGHFAEQCAAKYTFSREAQDAFALASIQRAQQAQQLGVFDAEITPVLIKDTQINQDDGPHSAKPDKIARLKPAFDPSGTITAASSSRISDGAAACVLMRADAAKAQGLRPLARIVAHSAHAGEPEWFTTAPIGAIDALLTKTGWRIDDVDLFEINEAFAVVAMAAMKAHTIPHDKLNVHGGACVLGHPLGATGARLVVTLLNALTQRQAKRGIAALCIGGGEATAIAIERLDEQGS